MCVVNTFSKLNLTFGALSGLCHFVTQLKFLAFSVLAFFDCPSSSCFYN